MQARTRDWPGRVEDQALLTGAGRFGDDAIPDRVLRAVFVRSPHAHARIGNVDASAARQSPGVVAVITGADLKSHALNTVTTANPIPGWSGTAPHIPWRPVLAIDRAMHVGEPVALVLAETESAALDAAELVSADYETLDPVIDLKRAHDASPLYATAAGNVALDYTAPNDPDGRKAKVVDDAFAAAAHVTRITITQQRIAAVSLEPRVATASFDPEADHYTLRVGTQGVTPIKMQTGAALKLAPSDLRVLTDDVGGGFGMKASGYPEYVALLLAAKMTGRPVHWCSTRSEAFMSDNQARDMIFDAELAMDGTGKITGLRVDVTADVGAYLTGAGLYCCTVHITGCLPTVYDIPNIALRSRAHFTNKVPIGPYRGAGRPEINFLMERLVDKAAREMKIDPAEMRRRNLIKPSQMPYATFIGASFDSGEFETILDKALAASDYNGFAARKAQSVSRNRRRGIGIGSFLEISGGILQESAAIKFPGDGKITVSIASSTQGQGHRTVFAKVVADRLGLPASAVTVLSGDSDRDVPGLGAVASRSAMLVGSAAAVTAGTVIEKGKAAAAILLQVDAEAIAFAEGMYTAAGGQQISLLDVALRAPELVSQGVLKDTLDTVGTVNTGPSYPNGCHIAEVEIDPETGTLAICRYTAVGDSGTVLDTVILEGQVHGGIAQGLGQALLEQVVYDTSSGQIVTGSFMDYGMPRAADMPDIALHQHNVACKTNAIGAKGAGESGTTAAPCALVNAILDAIGGDPGLNIDMPVTSEKIWRALAP